MAHDTAAAPGAADTFQHPLDGDAKRPGKGLGGLINLAGALVSVALIAGGAWWGYRLVMRDVTGIPIVRAVAGEMRIRPEEPGGELARHQGLAVNAIAAVGEAERPAERLVLAPQPVVLTDEDLPIQPQAVAIVQQAIADQAVSLDDEAGEDAVVVDPAKVAEAAGRGSVEDMVAALTEDVEPLEAAPGQESDAADRDAIGAALALAVAEGDGDSPARSLRPRLRPDPSVRTAAAPAAAADPDGREVDPADLPAGTRLVQLGAYDTAEKARSEWAGFEARFADLMADKSRVVQEARSGGLRFFRLRAMGFTDLADARRFCSVLVAEGADCIPVLTR
jgi:hypothetical protein